MQIGGGKVEQCGGSQKQGGGEAAAFFQAQPCGLGACGGGKGLHGGSLCFFFVQFVFCLSPERLRWLIHIFLYRAANSGCGFCCPHGLFRPSEKGVCRCSADVLSLPVFGHFVFRRRLKGLSCLSTFAAQGGKQRLWVLSPARFVQAV
ncbi:hypothetical protein NEIELOOT_00814 [Neisseria elongata subsp. glycolytica ATCC 29315]|uniref:Uncharacterized protein n=1 Tax=Neisseria elongata subsp. glycolytica ATCC 29315 TaxID=546263 RepID=D4DP29_NEIEG|nr:hypothetical protein NEIELOOT_00814 [Neisseria elongata subsp. glycolytica ATCC 29315]